MKLLLVDDDAFLRDMYAAKFTEAGHEVVNAKNGSDALALLEQSQSYDVVLMDMVMPGMTGTELIQKIRSVDTAGTIKCIVLSNQGEQEDIEAATKAGAAGYIVKAESIPSQVVAKVTELAT